MDKKNLFISWSGEMSKEIAEALKMFFEVNLQNVTPFFSPDIQKGTMWLESITNAISNSTAGILCLTKENVMKPWVLFECGALSRVGVVCPIVFGIKKEDISGPIGIFQASEFNKKEFRKLFNGINKSCGSALSHDVIENIFLEDGAFDKLETKINNLIKRFPVSNISDSGTIGLLSELNRKLDVLIEDKDTNQIDISYVEILVNDFLELHENLDASTKSKNSITIGRVSMALDYLVTQVDSSLRGAALVSKIEDLNKSVKKY